MSTVGMGFSGPGWDSHVHIVGDARDYPQSAKRTYTAAPASLADLRRHAAAHGIGRFVIVQPSFYGTDNTVLLETLDALDGAGRGVAVIDPATITSATLDDYAARGVCGLRINLYSTMSLRATPPLEDSFTALSGIAERMGWHVEVLAPIAMLAAHAALLAGAAAPVVIDHFGLYGDETPESEAGRTLLDLLRLPHVWMKLSAPYRVSADPLAIRADPAWMRAFLDTAPTRCVWGSDWPHTPQHEVQNDPTAILPYRDLRYEAVVDGFRESVPTALEVDRIMNDNPGLLYRLRGD